MSKSHPKFCPSCGYALGGEVRREVEEDLESDQFGSEHLDEEARPSDDSKGDREFADAVRKRRRGNRWVRS